MTTADTAGHRSGPAVRYPTSMTTPPGRHQSPLEELANTLSHGIGAGAAVVGAALVVGIAISGGDPFRISSTTIYGASLVLVFLSSTLYHGHAHAGPRPLLLLFDHVSIYLLIAGTYTPFALVTLRDAHAGWGWGLFGTVWALAGAGILFQVVAGARFPWLSTLLYAVMGWSGVFVAQPMWEALSVGGVGLLLGGGLAYTGGIAFFLWERLPFHHLVWHLFVLLGATLHYTAVLGYVAL